MQDFVDEYLDHKREIRKAHREIMRAPLKQEGLVVNLHDTLEPPKTLGSSLSQQMAPEGFSIVDFIRRRRRRKRR
jgi:hypothetical protein